MSPTAEETLRCLKLSLLELSVYLQELGEGRGSRQSMGEGRCLLGKAEVQGRAGEVSAL